MRITAITTILLAVITGCMQSNETSRLATADHEAETIEDCFTTLLAGSRSESGKLESVSFAHGICQGKSKALDKLSTHPTVTVVKEGTAYETHLYGKGQEVYASLEGLNAKIGNLSNDTDSSELQLIANAHLELAIETSNGIELWSPTTSVQGKEFIRIQLK